MILGDGFKFVNDKNGKRYYMCRSSDTEKLVDIEDFIRERIRDAIEECNGKRAEVDVKPRKEYEGEAKETEALFLHLSLALFYALVYRYSDLVQSAIKCLAETGAVQNACMEALAEKAQEMDDMIKAKAKEQS